MPDIRNGLLLVLMQPPASLEEEFTAWYDTEHVPERKAVPGFRTALRYVALSGYPRYMAVYDLDHVSVLDSPEYLAVSGDNFSPWTKRVTSRVQVYRIVAEQIFPGDAATQRSARVVLTRLRSTANATEEQVVTALRRAFEARPETTSLRVFKSCTDRGDLDYFCLAGLTPAPKDNVDLQPLGDLAGKVDLFNIYAPYDIGG